MNKLSALNKYAFFTTFMILLGYTCRLSLVNVVISVCFPLKIFDTLLSDLVVIFEFGIFKMAFELYGMLAGNVSPMTGENVKPAYGGEDEAFLKKVVTPIYEAIALVCLAYVGTF